LLLREHLGGLEDLTVLVVRENFTSVIDHDDAWSASLVEGSSLQ
jgi:hypothetical protein